MLTGVRDLDYKILNELDDKSLVSFCSANKKADEYCDDQKFWLNRVLIKFPYLSLDIMRKYKGEMRWSDYYIDLRKFENNVHKYDLMIRKILEESVKQGRLDHVMILLRKEIDVFRKSDLYNYTLKYNQLEILKYLVEQKWSFDFNYILIQGARLGYLDIVKYALQNGANIHGSFVKEVSDDEALREAVKGGNLNIVKYLVEHGANIHVYNDAPVKIAYRYDYSKIVDYLVSQGAPDPR